MPRSLEEEDYQRWLEASPPFKVGHLLGTILVTLLLYALVVLGSWLTH